MSVRRHVRKTFGELARPSKAKLALTLLLAISAYFLLMATKEVYNAPSLSLTIVGEEGDSPQLEMAQKTGVQLNVAVLVGAFPIAAIAMLAMFGGIASSFTCDAPGACELATGTAWIYFAAALVNLPYYYWIASFLAEGYKKVWQEENTDRKEFKKQRKK